MKKILFLLFFIPLMGISQAKFGGNSVAAARASLKNSNTYTLTYVDGIFYLVSTTTSYPIAFSTVGSTGTGNLVYATSPTLVTPNLGTPSAVTLTNGTGLPVSTGISGLGSGIATFLATPSSANLAAALTDETGTGNAVFSGSPTLTGTLTTSVIANTAGANFATSSGNVGIGRTASAYKLELQGDFLHTSSGATKYIFGTAVASSKNFSFVNYPNGFLATPSFAINDETAGATRFLINTNGNVGIGTTSPVYKLDVNGTTSSTNFITPNYFQGTGTNPLLFTFNGNQDIWSQGASGIIRFIDSGYSNVNFSVNQSGNGYFRGNLGVGTNLPQDKLQVVGKATFGDAYSSTTGSKITSIRVAHTNQQPYISLENYGNFGWRIGQTGSANGNGLVFSTGDTTGTKLSVLANGNVGIGTESPNAPLQFNNAVVNRKIVLYEDTNNDHQYFGFGVNNSTLRYQVNNPLSNHVFYAGTGTTTSQQLLSINGNQTVTYTPLTTTQINALTGMTAGTVAYNSTLGMLVCYNGTAWKRMDGTTNM